MNVVRCALNVLECPEPEGKARLSQEYLSAWSNGEISCEDMTYLDGLVPDRPARTDDKVQLAKPWEIKRGRGGSLASRQALLHSLVHIENWAVDLAWDIIARFGPSMDYKLPPAFFEDFVRVAEDEARHYSLLNARLEETGSHYGAFPAHDALWESAKATKDSLPARLAVEHCTHEARGLDILPQTIHRFRSNGDEKTAHLLETVVYEEEISHCAAGVRWLKFLFEQAHEPGVWPWPEEGDENVPLWVTDARKHSAVEQWFHALIRAHFRGPLKPPFNEAARARAGFGPEWYEPLAFD